MLACLLSPIAAGATSPKDIKIGVHVIDFVTNPPAGKNAIGVLYDSKVKESADDAQVILDALSVSLPHGATAPKPILVDIRDLDDAQTLRAVVVADHMKQHFDKVSAFGHRTGALILSADLECVRSNKCTVGIASSPRVEVILSSKQAQASGIQFSEAFRMMVTEY